MAINGPSRCRNPLGDSFADRLARFGGDVALVTPEGIRLSYAELAARADAFAARLGERRCLLMIAAANAVEPLIAYLAALRHRHPVLLSGQEAVSWDEARAGRIIEHYRPGALYAKIGGSWVLERTGSEPSALHPELGLLLSTSGSTGATRLVRLSYAAVEANAAAIAESLAIAPEDCAVTNLPIQYSYGLSVVNSHLARGARLAVTGASVTDDAFWDFFARENVTALAGVPYSYELFERVGLRDMALPSLRTMTQAGGHLRTDLARLYQGWAAARGVRFFRMYGQTEATARIACLPPALLADHPDSVGMALPGGEIRLVDAAGCTLTGPQAEGELVYSGPNVMMGYAETIADLAKGPELEALHTGDLACRDADGLYRIVGRKSRFAKPFGLRIALDEVEAMLAGRGLRGLVAGDDTILAVAIVGLDHGEGAVGPDHGEGAVGPDHGGVGDWLSRRLSLPIGAIDVARCDQPPLLPSGKIAYAAILDAARARRAAANPRKIRDAFQRIFPRAALHQGDSFTALGGDSLSYVGLSIDIERLVGHLPEQWEERPIGELEALAASRGAAAVGPSTEIETAIRAAAILAVLLNHAGGGLPVAGGANILLVLAGYSLARYHRPRLQRGEGWSVLAGFVKRIILPFYVIVAAYALWIGRPPWPTVLLVDNFTGRRGFFEAYWFTDALLQCLFLVVLLFSVGQVRIFAGRDPWRFGLYLLGASLLLRVAVFTVARHAHLLNRTPDAVFYFLALGWCLRFADTPARKRLIAAIAALLAVLEITGVPSLWYRYRFPQNLSHGAWMVAAAWLMLWVPRVRLPRPVHRAAGIIAAASFYIYLSHEVPLHLLSEAHLRLPPQAHLAGTIDRLIGLIVCLPFGIAIWYGIRSLPYLLKPVHALRARLLRTA